MATARRIGYRVLWADGRAQCWFTTLAVGPIIKAEVSKGARVYDYVPAWKG